MTTQKECGCEFCNCAERDRLASELAARDAEMRDMRSVMGLVDLYAVERDTARSELAAMTAERDALRVSAGALMTRLCRALGQDASALALRVAVADWAKENKA